MADRAHLWTDKKIEEIQSKLSVEYSDLQKSVSKKCTSFAKRIQSQAKPLMDDIENANDEESRKKANRAYKSYYVSLVASKLFKAFSKNIADEIYQTNFASASLINRYAPEVYAMNYNAIGYSLANDLDGYDFKEITEEEAEKFSGVERQSVDEKKDKAWNLRNLSNSVISGGLLQLAPLIIFAKAAKSIIEKNKNSAYRQASDMMTGAENSGRLDSMYRAYDEGFSVKKYWIATLDNRTRDTHIQYDGMDPVELDYEYAPGLKKPKDPDCSIMAEVCNCRCRILYNTGRGKSSTRTAREGDVTGSYKNPSSFIGTKTIKILQMTYEEWMKWRSK